ncbi:MAG: hypothetical protein SFZ24_08915 [Planctomycetota bacterium]|nr:hypothetical protein [Planctomycetota bacterium]
MNIARAARATLGLLAVSLVGCASSRNTRDPHAATAPAPAHASDSPPAQAQAPAPPAVREPEPEAVGNGAHWITPPDRMPVVDIRATDPAAPWSIVGLPPRAAGAPAIVPIIEGPGVLHAVIVNNGWVTLRDSDKVMATLWAYTDLYTSSSGRLRPKRTPTVYILDARYTAGVTLDATYNTEGVTLLYRSDTPASP